MVLDNLTNSSDWTGKQGNVFQSSSRPTTAQKGLGLHVNRTSQPINRTTFLMGELHYRTSVKEWKS